MSLHGLLLRQLKRLGIAPGGTPTAEQWQAVLERVSRAYTEADQDRYLLERSQATSSREMQELYGRLDAAQRVAGLGNWSFDRAERSRIWSDECFRIFGLDPSAPVPRYAQFVKYVDPRDRDALNRAVRGAWNDGRPFEAEFRLNAPDGEVRWVRSLGQPLLDAGGQAVRLHGTVMDITRRKLVELRQRMEHGVTRLLAEADDAAEAMPRLIQALCEPLGWACGSLWLIDRAQGMLRRQAVWAAPQGRAEAFYRLSRASAAIEGCNGLLGRTLGSQAPTWIADVSEEAAFTRRDAAIEAGLHAALAFPVEAGSEVLGLVELLSRRVQEPDAGLLQSAYFIGRQVGQFLHRKQAEAALRESEAHFRALVEQASDSFFVHDIDGRILDVNQHGCDTLQYTRDELLRMTLWDIAQDFSVRDLRALQQQLGQRAPIAMESRYRRRDGSTFPVEISIGPIEIDRQQHLLSLVRDISERRQLEEHIRHLAFHDALTELPNRAMFGRCISHAVVQAERYGKSLAVLFIDLDRFKNINDTLGHEAGDRLLQEMGRRLRGCLREGDLIARLGGDEFVVLVEEVTDPAYVAHVARKILQAMVREHVLDGQVIHITASIGISLYPQDGRDEKALMRFADIAMYRAKEKGKNGYQFFSAQMNQHSFEMLALESGLRRGLERNELVLHYQPKVELATGRIVGAEALVRWQHPELGLVPPGSFIPMAEESGLIVPMAQWVLREACRQHRAWRREGLPPLGMAVNLSARQFLDENLQADIAQSLAETGMQPEMLELEITESMVMVNPERAVQILAGLKAMGMSIAIDDFGIGYSSLSHLKRFQFDVLKIDQSFVKDVADDPACAAITQAIIAMSKSLNILLVAEGVETQAQLDFLRRNQCDQIQGYFFSRPVPAEAFAALVRRHQQARAPFKDYMPE